TSIGATNTRITAQLQGPPPPGIPVFENTPQGPVSFGITTSRNNFGLTVQQPPSAPIPVAAAAGVAKIVATVKQLAVSAVYSRPTFSFKA
ncbi:MAG: hypothetical protein JO199_11665, partial [Candidatus Eremiobacteraeota bacterium]|nr:hypothetical protein [Candidatus Eremiobacteraeota bacterium]